MADRRISDISLEWMLRKAESQGLRLRNDWAKRLAPDPLGDIKQSRRHVWRLLPARKRQVPAGAWVHSSVVKRMDVFADSYHPSNLPDDFVEVE